ERCGRRRSRRPARRGNADARPHDAAFRFESGALAALPRPFERRHDHRKTGHLPWPCNAMKERPWIWLIVANIVFIAGVTTLVVIAVRNKPQEVPIVHGR